MRSGGIEKVARDFEENVPGGKEDVGAQHQHVGEEAGSLDRRFAGGQPWRFEQFEYGMPGEGEQIESGQRHREKAVAVAEIVLEFVAVVFQYVEALICNRGKSPGGSGLALGCGCGE